MSCSQSPCAFVWTMVRDGSYAPSPHSRDRFICDLPGELEGNSCMAAVTLPKHVPCARCAPTGSLVKTSKCCFGDRANQICPLSPRIPLLLWLCLTRCQQNPLCSFCDGPLLFPDTRMLRNCSSATSMMLGGISKSPCAFGCMGKACSGSHQPCALIKNTSREPKGLSIVSPLCPPIMAPRLF